jgi:hypothetical protein
VQLDLDVPDVLNVESSVLFQATPVSVGGELDRMESVSPFEPWIARSFTRFDSSEERLERTVQPTQSRPGAGKVRFGKVRVGLASLFELAGLLTVRNGAVLVLISVTAFFESGVVEEAVSLEHRIESFLLLVVRVESELKRLSHDLGSVQAKAHFLNHRVRGEEGAAIPLSAKADGPLVA